MRIYTKAGDLAFRAFNFPDSQPHFVLETYEREFESVTIEMAIRSPAELFQVLLANQVLRANGYASVQLDIRYLMGARMDRAINNFQPFTLEVVSRLLNGAGFAKVRILDVHSDVALRLIRNSESVLPYKVVKQVYAALRYHVVTVQPDKGAEARVSRLAESFVVPCEKLRDTDTGQLSGFKVKDYHPHGGDCQECLIIDDICDGGGTFVGLANELRRVGASKVYLFITHGIFSKGLPLEGIDTIYTTDSYQSNTYGFERVVCIPVSMRDM